MRPRACFRTILALTLCNVGVTHAADRMIGVVPADGGARLVKRFTVVTGSTILGVEFESNDPRSVFPEVTLARGVSSELGPETIVAIERNVRESDPGLVRVTWASPVLVAAGGDYYVAVRMPTGLKRGLGDGPALGADDVGTPNGSFVCDADGSLLPIRADLAVNLLTAGTGKAAGEPTAMPQDGMQKTFVRCIDQPGGSIAFEVGVRSSAPLGLRIYDVTGKLVRLLAREQAGPGVHTRVWDGRHETGSQAAYGLYLLKASIGAEVVTRKFLLTR